MKKIILIILITIIIKSCINECTLNTGSCTGDAGSGYTWADDGEGRCTPKTNWELKANPDVDADCEIDTPTPQDTKCVLVVDNEGNKNCEVKTFFLQLTTDIDESKCQSAPTTDKVTMKCSLITNADGSKSFIEEKKVV